RQGYVHRSCGRVRQRHPHILVVRLDRGCALAQGLLEPHICVDVAVRHVVDHLPNGPTAGTVRRVELARCEPGYRGAQRSWRTRNVVDQRCALRLRNARGRRELADWITQIGHCNLERCQRLCSTRVLVSYHREITNPMQRVSTKPSLQLSVRDRAERRFHALARVSADDYIKRSV